MKICSIKGCAKPLCCRGMCEMHYARARKEGLPVRPRRKKGEAMEALRLLMSVEISECLPWPLSVNPSGYGVLTFRGKLTLASRAMCIMAHGDPPSAEHEAAHSCGNGHLACTNKRHLRWATPEENEADKLVIGRVRKADEHWKTELTADDVLAIMRDPRGSKLLAKEYPVSARQIRHIRKGGSWNSVTGLPPLARPPSKQTKRQREAA